MKKAIVALGICVFVGAVGATTHLGGIGERPATPASASSRPLPPETQALLGTWESRAPAMRLTVKSIRSQWASLLFLWQQDGADRAPWIRTWGKVLPGGSIHISYPVHLTFRLSEDHDALLGTQGWPDTQTTVVFARTAPDNKLARTLPHPH